MNQMSEGIVKPFAITAVAWLTLGSSLIYWLSETEIYSGVIWFFGIWITCIINLFLLGKTVASLLQMMSDTAQVKSVGNILRLSIWAFLKLFVLGVCVVAIRQFANEISFLVMLLGFGTLVIVPLGGSFWWSLKNAS